MATILITARVRYSSFSRGNLTLWAPREIADMQIRVARSTSVDRRERSRRYLRTGGVPAPTDARPSRSAPATFRDSGAGSDANFAPLSPCTARVSSTTNSPANSGRSGTAIEIQRRTRDEFCEARNYQRGTIDTPRLPSLRYVSRSIWRLAYYFMRAGEAYSNRFEEATCKTTSESEHG